MARIYEEPVTVRSPQTLQWSPEATLISEPETVRMVSTPEPVTVRMVTAAPRRRRKAASKKPRKRARKTKPKKKRKTMPRKKTATVKETIVVAAPRRAPARRRRTSAPAKTSRRRSSRRSSGGTGKAAVQKEYIELGTGGLALGFIIKTFGDKIPEVPYVGRLGTIAAAGYLFHKDVPILLKAGKAAVAIAGFQLGSGESISGDDYED